MSKKQDFILNYIKSLSVGEKISTRNLAETLCVSEGTAYKAIKKAEELNLVQTRPRAGTLRISDTYSPNPDSLTLHTMIQQLGLSVIVPGSDLDAPIYSIIIGDGTAERLRSDASKNIGNKICIVGERPTILSEAIHLGIHLLVTGDANISSDVRSMAAKKDVCILSTRHSTHTILHFLYSSKNCTPPASASPKITEWMRPPQYLYYNDTITDWYDAYAQILHLNDTYAVVDDNLSICGLVDTASIFNASPTEKVSGLYNNEKKIHHFTMPEDSSLYDVADKMIAEDTEIAYIENNKKLKGVITANDILRFLRFNTAAYSGNTSIMLKPETFGTSDNKCTYSLEIPSNAFTKNLSLSHTYFSVIMEAAERHLSRKIRNSRHFSLTGCTLCCPISSPLSNRALVTSRITGYMQNIYFIEIEISDDSGMLAKCMLNYSIL